MNFYFRNAPFDNIVKIITAFVVILLVALMLVIPSPIIIFITLIVFGITIIFMVRGYSITNDNIIIHHWGWSQKYALTDLDRAYSDPSALNGSIRLFGIGGLMGYIGYFRNSALGTYRAYVTNRHHAIILMFKDKTLVISPEDTVGFLKQIEADKKKSV